MGEGTVEKYILDSAADLGVRLVTTNRLPDLPPKRWHYRRADGELVILIEGNISTELHEFLTRAVGPKQGQESFDGDVTSGQRQAFYGANLTASVALSAGFDEAGRAHTSLTIVGFAPTRADRDKLRRLLSPTNANDVASRPSQRGGMLEILECHDRAVTSGKEVLDVPREVDVILGATNVDHFISKFQSSSPEWNSVGYFEGRYRFSLKLPIHIDHESCRVIGSNGSVTVQINEVVKVEFSKSGIAGATMQGQWRLNESEWKRVVANNGDWSIVQVPIRTGAPVASFSEYERQGRAPLRDRKKGFDNPIRETLETLRKQQSEEAKD